MYETKSPFSILVELSQKHLISAPIYEDLGELTSKQWLAKVSVTRDGIVYEGQAFAAGKKDAKIAAARQVLDKLSTEKNVEPACTKPVFSPHPEDVPHYNLLLTLARNNTPSSIPYQIISLDLEVYEYNHRKVTEIGISYCRIRELRASPLAITTRHLIIKENICLSNGRFVEDNKFNFDFGVSEFVSASEVKPILRDLVEQSGCRVVLVGHSVQNDLEWLQSLGINIKCTEESIIDIALADRLIRQAGQVRGLERMLEEEGLKPKHLHNGGNDAYWTMELFLLLARRLAVDDTE